jgi:predicted nucleic acid-binding protein
MRTILADTSYWVALVDSRDQWHEKAAVKDEGITESLTTDGHFTQKGFTILLREQSS